MHLRVTDRFKGRAAHRVRVPLQLAVGWRPHALQPGRAQFCNDAGRRLEISWSGTGEWRCAEDTGDIAPSYGVLRQAPRLRWDAAGPVGALCLTVEISIRSP